jgi:uncharacterized cupin superfamily protein
MPNYTKVNVKDVEDSATKFGFAPDMEARFAAGDLGLEKAGLSYQALAPGFRQPFGHTHKTQEEIYVVVSGSGRVKLDDEIVELAQYDLLRVPRETARCFEGGPDGIAYVVFGAPKAESAGADAEQIPGWWSD